MENFKYQGPTDTHPDHFVWLETFHFPSGEGWDRAADTFLKIIGYEEPTANRKPKLPFRDHMKILLWNIAEAYNEEPSLYVGVRSGKGSYKVNDSFGNPLGVSYKIVECYERLEMAGLIEVRKGNFNRGGDYSGSSRCTRIRAKPELFFRLTASLEGDHWVHFNKDRPRINLREKRLVDSFTKKGKPRKKPKSFSMEYEIDTERGAMIALIERYQEVLDASEITIDGLSGNYVTWPRKRKKKHKKQPPDNRKNITRRNTFISRSFNEGRFDLGGRFYGPWWQGIPDWIRKKILINGQPTIELDYSGLHVKLLYAELGEMAPDDPYMVSKWIFPEVYDATEQRKYAKILLLASINATDRKKAFAGFRKMLHDEEDDLSGIKDKEIEYALNEILEVNPIIQSQVCSGKGLQLMNVDSKVSELIISHFTSKGIPVLTIHDSFIVAQQHRENLRYIMHKAMKDIVGIEVSFK